MTSKLKVIDVMEIWLESATQSRPLSEGAQISRVARVAGSRSQQSETKRV